METRELGMYIAAIVVLLVFSGYFSATETAFTSINRIKLKNMANDGNRRARQVLELEEKYDTLLSLAVTGGDYSWI